MTGKANILPLSPKVRQRQSRTRERIVSKSAALFIDKGFENVSVEEIIEAAEIARSSFYRFFSNREDVLSQIIRPVFEQGIEEMAAIHCTEPQETMAGLFNAYLRIWRCSPNALRLSTRAGGVHFSLFKDLHAIYRSEILRVLATVARTGALLNDDADASGRLIARIAVPILEVYATHPRQEEMFHLTMRGLLLKPEYSL